MARAARQPQRRRAGTDVGCLSSPGAAPRFVNVTIANLHFHTPSEHTLDGARPPGAALFLCSTPGLPCEPHVRPRAGRARRTGEHFAMESHLVTTLAQKDVPACPASSCIAVFGAFYRLGGADSGFLAQLTPYVNTSGVVRRPPRPGLAARRAAPGHSVQRGCPIPTITTSLHLRPWRRAGLPGAAGGQTDPAGAELPGQPHLRHILVRAPPPPASAPHDPESLRRAR